MLKSQPVHLSHRCVLPVLLGVSLSGFFLFRSSPSPCGQSCIHVSCPFSQLHGDLFTSATRSLPDSLDSVVLSFLAPLSPSHSWLSPNHCCHYNRRVIIIAIFFLFSVSSGCCWCPFFFFSLSSIVHSWSRYWSASFCFSFSFFSFLFSLFFFLVLFCFLLLLVIGVCRYRYYLQFRITTTLFTLTFFFFLVFSFFFCICRWLR